MMIIWIYSSLSSSSVARVQTEDGVPFPVHPKVRRGDSWTRAPGLVLGLQVKVASSRGRRMNRRRRAKSFHSFGVKFFSVVWVQRGRNFSMCERP